MVAPSLFLLALVACGGGDDEKTPTTPGPTTPPVPTTSTPPVPTTSTPPAVDTSERLGPGEVRAGVIADEAALFGGVSAEGRVGDVKIYNDRVQFVIQSGPDSSYYLSLGGTVIDADIVRPEGEQGRDLVDEWAPMYGLGRVMEPTSIEVVADGSDGEAAIVRVTGHEVALGLIEGALEAEGFIDDLGLTMVTDYVLAPDSYLLEVRSTITATDGDASINPGDILMGAPEVGRPWVHTRGMGGPTASAPLWSAYVADDGDVAVAIVPAPEQPSSGYGFELLAELAELVAAAIPLTEIDGGTDLVFVRHYGVAPDLATLSDAALTLHGLPVDVQAGIVSAPDGPVAGARVNVLVDGEPFSVATSGDDGAYQLLVPDGATVDVQVEGRGTGRFFDFGPGAGHYAPYASPAVRAATLDSLAAGAPGSVRASGRGVADGVGLGEPATLRILAADAGPFTARVGFQGGDPVAVDEALVLPRAGGLAAAGWATRGELVMQVEPGTYDLVVHRGLRHELVQQEVVLTAGEEVLVDVDLPLAYDHAGWLLGDPHSHASPSADGGITMEERVAVAAAVGVQLHFGTDHDHLADYRPIVGALGLEDRLGSVVSDEVSPPLRGHMNIYPVAGDPDAPNGGSFRWWTEIPETTDGLVDTLRARHGDDFVLQLNHPLDSGVGSAADWSPGVIGDSDRWTDRFDAMEVLNAADTEEYLSIWWDVVLRGSRAVPTGVSDSHNHFGGSVGMSATWLHTGIDAPGMVDDATLAGTFRGGELVVTRGPFLELSTLPGDVASGTVVEVTAHSPSWIVVDRLQLWRDGAMVEEVLGTEASFTLTPEADAVYVVVAEGDTPMQPVTSRTPWAMTAPWRVDVGGDGFTPPLPPLTME